MSANRCRVVGPVVLPDGAPVASGGHILFRLQTWDRDGHTVVLGGAVEAVIVDGAIDIELWRTTSGDRQAAYAVSYRYWSETGAGMIEEALGNISLTGAGPVNLSDLLTLPAPLPNVPDALAQALGAAASAKADAAQTAEDRIAVGGMLEGAEAAALRAEGEADRAAGEADRATGEADRAAAHLASLAHSPEIVQKFMMEPVFGSTAAADPAEIYPGAGFAAQAVAYAKIAGVEYVFITQRFVGDNNQANERCRIVQFALKDDGSAGAAVAVSQELNLGHGGNLSALVEGETVTLIGYMPVDSDHVGTDSGKGISIITWRGAETRQADVRALRLFGWEGSGEARSQYYGAHPTLSTDGKHLALLVNRKPLSGPFNPTAHLSVMVFDLAQVLASSNGLSLTPLHLFEVSAPGGAEMHVYQGIAMNRSSIAVLFGFGSALCQNAIKLYDFEGHELRDLRPTLEAGRYGYSNLVNHPSLGIPYQLEPEGLTFRGEDELLLIMLDQWRLPEAIVSVEGRNYACKVGGQGIRVANTSSWTLTTKPATHGAWSMTESYSGAMTITQRAKKLWSVRVPKGEVGEVPLAYGIGDIWYDRTSSLRMPNSAPDIEFKHGDTFQIAGYSSQEDRHYRALEFGYNDIPSDNTSSGILRVFSPYGSPSRYGRIRVMTVAGGVEHIEFGGSDAGTWGRVLCYGINDISNPGVLHLLNADGAGLRVNAGASGAIRPIGGGMPALGTVANMFGTVYLNSSPVVTSDERFKTEIIALSEAELQAGLEIGRRIGAYRLLAQGDGGKTQIGVGAQTVVAILQRHGLDPEAYNFVQRNIETRDDGSVHDQYSVVYEQLNGFILRALVERLG